MEDHFKQSDIWVAESESRIAAEKPNVLMHYHLVSVLQTQFEWFISSCS